MGRPIDQAKLVILTSFRQAPWQVVTLTRLNLLILWPSLWQGKTCNIRRLCDKFEELDFFSAGLLLKDRQPVLLMGVMHNATVEDGIQSFNVSGKQKESE